MARGKTREISSSTAGLEYWAHRVLVEIGKIDSHFNSDAVHDLRVALRRCRSMAADFVLIDPDPGWKHLKKLGKPVFARLGELRDVQVMVEWVNRLGQADDPVRKSLLDALATKEQQLKKDAQVALLRFDRKHWEALAEKLTKHNEKVPLDGVVFQELAVECWENAYRLHCRALQNPSQMAFHQLRIGLKKFRYTVENFLPQRNKRWGEDLAKSQDLLGEAHDLGVLLATLRGHAGILAMNSACTGRRKSKKNANTGWQSIFAGWLGHTACGKYGVRAYRTMAPWRRQPWQGFALGLRSLIRTRNILGWSLNLPCSSMTDCFETKFFTLARTLAAFSKRPRYYTMLGVPEKNTGIKRNLTG